MFRRLVFGDAIKAWAKCDLKFEVGQKLFMENP
jgi:hypothetical protein